MGIFLGNNNLAPAGGGGGGGIPGSTDTQVNGITYPVISGDIQNSFTAIVNRWAHSRGSLSTTAYNQPTGISFGVKGTGHDSLIGNSFGGSVANTSTNLVDITSGNGGIFHWAYVSATQGVPSFSAQTPVVGISMTITIDGGTPLVLNAASISGSTNAGSHVGGQCFLGVPAFSETGFNNQGGAGISSSGISSVPVTAAVTSSSQGVFGDVLSVLGNQGRGSGSNGQTYGNTVRNTLLNGDLSRKNGIPGLLFETSLSIDVTLTGSGNTSQLSSTNSACITQF